MKYVSSFSRLFRAPATVALLGTALLACAGSSASSHSALPPGGQAWTLTFGGSPCVLHGTGDLVTEGGCGEQRKLAVTPAVAKDLGAKVRALQPEREMTDGGQVTLLSAGATTTRIEPTQGDAVLRALEGYLDRATLAAREARFTESVKGISCPAGQIVLTVNTCPGDPNNPAADVCGPAAHTCGAPVAAGGACQHDNACASQHCSATGVCQ